MYVYMYMYIHLDVYIVILNYKLYLPTVFEHDEIVDV